MITMINSITSAWLKRLIPIPMLLALAVPVQPALAQGTAFTYQGRLNDNSTPVNGNFDLTFALFDTNSGGGAVAGPVTNLATLVSNGLFTTTIDFGPSVFTGASNWLQLAVRTNGGSGFTTLTPRQQIGPTPYAIYSESSGAANSVVSNGVSVGQLNTPAAPANGQVLTFIGGSMVWTNPASGGSGWSLTGNAGTSPGTDFLGTTDNAALQLRVNGVQGLTLTPTANNALNLTIGPFAGATIGGEGIVAFGGYSGAYDNVYANYSTIAGGFNNTINSGPESVIAGGQGNSIGGSDSAIGGGFFNTVNGEGGAIPGGFNNLVSGVFGFAAGNGAQATNAGSFVWADNSGGTFASTNNNQFSVRAMGGVNFVTGGAGLKIDGQAVSTSGGGGGGGGTSWSLTGNAGTVPGIDFLGTTDAKALELYVNGGQALLLDTSANVVAGQSTTVPGSQATTIGGGFYSTATSAYCGVIGGGYDNSVTADYSTVSGGQLNSASANGAAVGGGYDNVASGNEATISGGTENAASGAGAVVGGGGFDGNSYAGNNASGGAATVAGGLGNTASSYATVAGGQNNNAGASFSAILGGVGNIASGFASTVPGGNGNLAGGIDSFAAGNAAHAVNNGAFVWADDSTSAPFASTANNQFNVRATGGVRFLTGGAGMTIDGVPVVPGGGGGGGSSSNSWQLTGNTGANPANGFFLGTTDTNGLEFHVNGIRSLRLDYSERDTGFPFLTSSESINVTGGCWNNAISNGVLGGTIAGGGYALQTGDGFYSYTNYVNGDFGTIGGGYGNTAGYGGTVPGGYNNIATGTASFAAGNNAQAPYDDSFVWSDGSSTFSGPGPNRFDVLATGGALFHTGGGYGLAINNNGNVGINTATPQAALEVNGNYLIVDGPDGEKTYFGSIGGTVDIGSFNTEVTAVDFVNLATLAPMHIDCSSITIEGGSDLAEPFQIAPGEKDIPEGSVVVIDEANPGQLKRSDRPYDTCVAGVVSGANGIHPGIQMQQKGLLEGGKNVALTGRVYVQADASYGAIKPGDLLTSSATPGCAMRVSDHAKAQGAILGKAMTGLKDGQGMVLVLVTLQ
jgi:hypothetical protein